MSSRELILNLWYVVDEDGIIFSLRAKVYVGDGSDEDKLAFLRQRAGLDYLVAEPFEVPERFFIEVGIGAKSKTMEVAHVSMMQTLDSPITLFEDAIQVLHSRIPAQSEVEITQNPLVCTTPLMQNEHGVIEPRFFRQMQY